MSRLDQPSPPTDSAVETALIGDVTRFGREEEEGFEFKPDDGEPGRYTYLGHGGHGYVIDTQPWLPDAEGKGVGFKPDDPDPIYGDIERYQRHKGGELKDLAAFFHDMADAFNERFGLDVPELVISIDFLPKKTLGRWRMRNGLGLKNEITLSAEHVMIDERWDVNGTLLHELLHAWQHLHGEKKERDRGHHNREFRDKAAELGLIVTKDGSQEYEPESPFLLLLAERGVDLPTFTTAEPLLPDRPDRPSKSKLRPWTCACFGKPKLQVSYRVDWLPYWCPECRTTIKPVAKPRPTKDRPDLLPTA